MTMRLRGALVLCLATAGACAKVPDPRAPAQRDIERGAYGGWVRVLTARGPVESGELLALSAGGLHLLQGEKLDGRGFVARRVLFIEKREIRVAQVWGYERETFWSWGGGAVMYLNLWNLVIPISMVVTVIVADNELAEQSSALYPSQSLSALNRWARFPQGLPAGLDPNQLLAPPPAPAASTPAAPAPAPAAPVP